MVRRAGSSTARLPARTSTPGEEREIGPAESVYVAARHGRSGELARLLESGVAPTWADRNGSTALHQACMAGHVGCVQMLLDYHAAIDAPDEHGVTPLMLAAMANRADGVQALLSAGSSLEACAEGGLARMGFWLTILQGTALQIAERAGNAECVALLRGESADMACVCARVLLLCAHESCFSVRLSLLHTLPSCLTLSLCFSPSPPPVSSPRVLPPSLPEVFLPHPPPLHAAVMPCHIIVMPHSDAS